MKKYFILVTILYIYYMIVSTVSVRGLFLCLLAFAAIEFKVQLREKAASVQLNWQNG